MFRAIRFICVRRLHIQLPAVLALRDLVVIRVIRESRVSRVSRVTRWSY